MYPCEFKLPGGNKYSNQTFRFKDISPNATMTGLLEEPEDFDQKLQNVLVNRSYAFSPSGSGRAVGRGAQ